jgi:Tol biopolymer transport system component
MRSFRIVGLVVVVAALVLGTAQAGASPRGVNGQITYDQIVDPNTGEKAVAIANPDGSNARVLVPPDPVSCCADFSPDGSKLAFPYPTADGRLATAIINADGSGYTPFPIDDPLGTLNVPCGPWSPDGKRLACEVFDNTNPDRGGIYTISSADGSNLTRVTNPNGGDDQPGAYSPNGKQLVFARFGPGQFFAEGLFVVNTDGTHLRQITPPGTIIRQGNDGDWSPQGNEIIFSRHVTPDVLGSIWVIHANSAGLHEIHIHGLGCGASFSDPNGAGCHGVRWSPDGKKIIFSGVTAAGFNIYTANADGTGLTQVTFDGNGDDPAWGTHPLAP